MITCSCKVGELRTIASGEELRQLQLEQLSCESLVLDMSDWRIIPAENMVAALQVRHLTESPLFAAPLCSGMHAS